MIPSLSDFGTHANSLYPHLWDSCFFAFAPGLGNSSNKAIDWATGTTSVFTNFSASRWGYDSGIPYLEGGANDSTNTRARFNWQSSNNPISLAAWVYWTGQATNAMPLTVGGTDAYLRVTTGTSIPDFSVNNGNGRATGATSVAVNGWTHLCGVRDSGELRLYVNGVLDSTRVYPAGAVFTTDVIGVYSLQDTTASNYFAGRLDDAFVWSRPLNVDEIKLLSSQRNIAFTRRASRSMRVAWPSDAATAITGTAAATTDGATSNASGRQVFSGAATPVAGGDQAAALGQLRFEPPLISAPYIALAGDASAANAAQVFVSVVFHTLAPDTSAAFAVAGGSSGSAAAITGSDSSLFFGQQLFEGFALSFTGNDTSLFFGLAGGYGGQVVVSLSSDTGVASGVLKFITVGNPSLGGDSVTNQQGSFSLIDVLWEDAYTVEWESGESIRWDEQLVIQAGLLGVAGPASLAAFGTNTPPPSSSGFVFASSGPATAFPPAIGRLKFTASGSATGGSATAAIAAVTVVGQTVVNATLFTGHDYLTVTARLKFTAFVVGDSGPATGICIGPLCDVDGALSSQLGNDFVFVDSDGCRLVARESEHVFVASVSRYIFRASACTVIA